MIFFLSRLMREKEKDDEGIPLWSEWKLKEEYVKGTFCVFSCKYASARHEREEAEEEEKKPVDFDEKLVKTFGNKTKKKNQNFNRNSPSVWDALVCMQFWIFRRLQKFQLNHFRADSRALDWVWYVATAEFHRRLNNSQIWRMSAHLSVEL